MENPNNSILVALNDSISSKTVIDFLEGLSLCPEDWHISLLHFFRKPSSSEDLMGKKFVSVQPSRMMSILQKAKDRLIEKGFDPERIETELIDQPYQTVADGIIDQVRKRNSNLVIIGRKRMSKAEEFVMGDISVKLIRALEGAAVLVVKSS
ncbi:universal stress protein [Deltaproteobacteria bacterium]|nr:universal stress protein [Deltaproteobacteria bacterium]